VAANVQTVQRIAMDGFEIGTHGTSHPQFTKISADRVYSDITNCANIISNATGGLFPKPYFRFPYGDMNAGVVRQSIRWASCPSSGASTRATGATTPGRRSSTLIVGQTGPGAIVLMHDTPKTASVLPQVIDGLRAKA